MECLLEDSLDLSDQQELNQVQRSLELLLLLNVIRQWLSLCNRASYGRESRWTGPFLSHLGLKPPLDISRRVNHKGCFIDHGASPVTFAFGSNLSAQGTIWIWDQPHRKSARRILPKGFMCLGRGLVRYLISDATKM